MHTLYRSCHCWKHRRKASFGIFRSSAVAFYLLSSTVAKGVPLRPIFRVGNRQKSLEARSGEYGSWVMAGMLFSARNCCTTSDVCLGASPDLTSSDLCLLSTLKIGLKGTRFATVEDNKWKATAELQEILKETFRRCFQQWHVRWSKCVCVCVCAQDSYFEGY
jgi:hypothetical protein